MAAGGPGADETDGFRLINHRILNFIFGHDFSNRRHALISPPMLMRHGKSGRARMPVVKRDKYRHQLLLAVAATSSPDYVIAADDIAHE